ncbi:MAG: hypothetical protein C7B44_02350 [Sulfobacillus thermosulfidooxidans]|uniref:Thioredoxin domain-containing protein n=1 Tax=Sulfobacillus thermotolerans TaxID=338644 RepID=A0ABM6RP96_9FIRM|nr:hypothetical protein [Sulfobacillus sp. hq2]AUW93127.1 hypothetical protein BXT84_03465 [Sulfobacillus thermotolerans]MCY0908272.1 hypothetical protein [Sulfobacillus thermotolerans]POB10071.1 hypothetical protein CO251_11815 [Sulfobacillus sp. hq2]PSR37727.1 MAG: hypothetical protein C7B44_02350 [Sulfobacillus thermosulfidooxidans]
MLKYRALLWPVVGILLIGILFVALHRRAVPALPPASPSSASSAASSLPPLNGNFVNAQTGKQELLTTAEAGKPTLLWFVTTWCASCHYGTQFINQHWTWLAQHHIQVIELEAYHDMGQKGPAMTPFMAGIAPRPLWIWGTAGRRLTAAFDSAAYPDIYFLLSAHNHVQYYNSSPGSTWKALTTAIMRSQK